MWKISWLFAGLMCLVLGKLNGLHWNIDNLNIPIKEDTETWVVIMFAELLNLKENFKINPNPLFYKYGNQSPERVTFPEPQFIAK